MRTKNGQVVAGGFEGIDDFVHIIRLLRSVHSGYKAHSQCEGSPVLGHLEVALSIFCELANLLYLPTTLQLYIKAGALLEHEYTALTFL